MEKVFARPALIKDAPGPYCPGCGHPLVLRLLAEVIGEMGIARQVVGVPSGGCALQAYGQLDLDMGEAPHGRGVAVATGLKLALPGSVVFAYQENDDLAAVGTGGLLHAASRGENLTVLLVNNGAFGLGGEGSAPRVPSGPGRTALAKGRRPMTNPGWMDIAGLLTLCEGSCYIERVSVTSPKKQARAKKAISSALRTQMDGLGLSLVEILSPCPAYWQLSPVEALKFVDDTLADAYPLGVLKDVAGFSESG